MTKRFIYKIKKGRYVIIDIKNNTLIRDMYRACDILNQLSEGNEQLKSEKNELLEENITYKNIWLALKDRDNEIKQLKQDKKRLIGFLHRYKGVDVEDVDEEVLSKEYLDEWGELYFKWKKGDVE
ncbi:MAG: hypothetical protein IJF83_10885 [Methanobrevibacter sp.]|nr:hypothetical protein [Methanobrevibacter sp.]